MASLFTKIIRGEIPSYKIYEDEHCFAFLDIRPIHPGHTLVVPKKEVDHFHDMEEPGATAVFHAAQKISKAIQKATGAPRVGAAVIGFEVPHAHYHLVPIWGPRDLNFQYAKELPKEQMRDVQERIIQALASA